MPDVLSATIAREDYGLREASRKLDKTPATVTRWVRSGARIPGGSVVKLHARLLGSQYRFTDADLRDFLDETTAASLATSPKIGGRQMQEAAYA